MRATKQFVGKSTWLQIGAIVAPTAASSSRVTAVPARSVYWEGAVRSIGGRGHLEPTGYAVDLKM